MLTDDLERGRECFRTRRWQEAFAALTIADGAASLAASDLELLATSAHLTGREADYAAALDRAHHAHVADGERRRAARCAFWLCLQAMLRGQAGPMEGWLARARRLLEGEAQETPEHGYLLIVAAQCHANGGEWEAACKTADSAAAIGERHIDRDLIACARHVKGRTLIRHSLVHEGVVLLDEVMIEVTSGELSPIMTGLLYCSVIEGCQEVLAWRRASEWTNALSRWCAQQSQLVAFTGVCLAHRAEILALQGNWDAALEEARCAATRALESASLRTAAAAYYQQAEVHRMRGDARAAEDAYQEASQLGAEPQPGLALLRLAQGRAEIAHTALRRLVITESDQLQRMRYLPAYIAALLALGNIAQAADACRDLDDAAARYRSGPPGALDALAAQALGEIDIVSGRPEAALVSLRHACRLWQQMEAPYALARTRVLVARACRALNDEESCALELQAARATFEKLRAADDLANALALSAPSASAPRDIARGSCPLTDREVEVLRLVAAGKTNKAVARQLCISERTVDRHLSKIFNKLDVPSRTAAAAYAFSHNLIGG